MCDFYYVCKVLLQSPISIYISERIYISFSFRINAFKGESNPKNNIACYSINRPSNLVNNVSCKCSQGQGNIFSFK